MSERPQLEKSMSFATVIILGLLIATIVGGRIVVVTLIRNIKGTSTSSGNGASTTSSSASASSSSPPPTGNNRGLQIPSWLGPIFLAIAGLWLILRVLAFKDAPENLEAVLAVTIALIGAFLVKKEMRFAGFILSGIIIFMVLFPGIMTWLQEIRQSQLNPPGEMAPIVINRDGEYDLPDRPLKVCFTLTGDPNQNFYIDNKVEIGGKLFVQREAGCPDIPPELKGKVSISLLSGKPYSEKVKSQIGMTDVNNNYEYYKKIGFGEYPTIFAK